MHVSLVKSSFQFVLACTLLLCLAAFAQQTQPSGTSKQLGVVKSVSGRMIVLASESGSDYQVTIPETARLVRVAPGQRDLKDATPAHVEDIGAGDRILVRGTASDDGKSIIASLAVLMSSSDISRKRQEEREDWRKRGIAGLVKNVDLIGGTVTISTGGFNRKDVIIRVPGDAVVRRYAPDSVRFDDAKRGALKDIHPGDQLRARGVQDTNADTFTAEEIVSGTFRNIAGTILSVDAGAGTIEVSDLANKKTVELRTSSDSQLRALPPEFAEHVAARLRAQGTPSETHAQNNHGTPGRNGDVQQIIGRLPAVQLSDLHKGEAVMIVATEAPPNAPPTAITVLTGVDAILSAAPNAGGAAALLSPWSIGGADPGAAQ